MKLRVEQRVNRDGSVSLVINEFPGGIMKARDSTVHSHADAAIGVNPDYVNLFLAAPLMYDFIKALGSMSLDECDKKEKEIMDLIGSAYDYKVSPVCMDRKLEEVGVNIE